MSSESSGVLRNGYEAARVKAKKVGWLAVLAVAGPFLGAAAGIIYDAGGESRKLDNISRQLSKIEGAQSAHGSLLTTQAEQVKALTARATEDRARIAALERQMAYRLQLEATVRAIHPDVNFP